MPATLTPPSTPSAIVRDPIFRLSVEKFDQMVRIGALDENDPVEFIDGILYLKMPINPPHNATANAIAPELLSVTSKGWSTRFQSTVALPDGRPEPDVAIVRGTPFTYSIRHPVPADVALIIEVSDSTLTFDRTTKLASYARAGVVEYWIVNLIDRQIEVHTQPVGDGYASRVVFASTDTIALPATLGGATIAVADLLPPA